MKTFKLKNIKDGDWVCKSCTNGETERHVSCGCHFGGGVYCDCKTYYVGVVMDHENKPTKGKCALCGAETTLAVQ